MKNDVVEEANGKWNIEAVDKNCGSDIDLEKKGEPLVRCDVFLGQ